MNDLRRWSLRPRWRRPTDTIIGLVVAAVGVAALLTAGLGLLAHQLDTGWQPMVLAAAAAHQLLWAAPVAVILLGATRRWSLLAVSGAVLLLAVPTQVPLYVGSASPPAAGALTVMQANLKVGNADPERLTSIVTARHVDVLMTEELTPSERNRLIGAGLANRLPYRFDAALAGGGGGLAIWSRYPLQAEHNYPGFELGVLQARLRIGPSRTVTVLAVHLLPPYPYPDREWLAEMSRLRPLLIAAKANGEPVIAAGDFNATSDHAQFRKLMSAGYSDAAEQVGAGYLASYPTDRWYPPLLAIDHILTSRAVADNIAIVDLPGSDHRGLLAQVALPTR